MAAARLSTATTQLESDDSTKIATTAYVVDKITTLIGGAPSTLNDLNELALAINDDASYNSTLTTALATKLPLAGGTMTGGLAVSGVATINYAGTDSFATIVGPNNRDLRFDLRDNGDTDSFQFRNAAADTLLTILRTGNVGIGVTPSGWPSNGDFKALQIGTGAAVYGRGSGDEAKSGLTANAYLDGTDDRFEYIGNSYASHYRQSDGNHTFWTAPSGSADAAITFTNVLDIGRDGKVSTWQGSGMTSHFNVGNRDIDVGTSTGYANRQERIGLMAADPWGTAAGIYLSVSRNTNQDGRSHPSLHFTGNHGAGQSEDYLMMSMNSNFYGAESVNIGSSGNDANLEVNGQLTVLKQPSFLVNGSPTLTSGDIHSFSNILHNVGSHYVNSTGRFTAPVAGRYLFTAGIWAQASSNNWMQIRINNAGDWAGFHVHNTSASSGSVSVVLSMAANDYASINCYYNVQGSTPRNYFSGILIG